MARRICLRSRHETCLYARVVLPRPLRALLGRREYDAASVPLTLRLGRLQAAAFAVAAALAFEALMRSRSPDRDEFMDSSSTRSRIDQKSGTLTAERIEIRPAARSTRGRGIRRAGRRSARQLPPSAAPKSSRAHLYASRLIAAFVTEKSAAESWTAKTQQASSLSWADTTDSVRHRQRLRE